ncbi:hypothetical protein DVH24_038584 [Malus domestica]|uniref:Uncharacterized protein n=1 Tax=Malus domestica TaxID=3750 RepID=A0A498K7T4_MALDO|nr:hypothetical protein DVH24_038584 [Malus domestica]
MIHHLYKDMWCTTSCNGNTEVEVSSRFSTMVMEWIRGNQIGRGDFPTIYTTKHNNSSFQLSTLMVVIET